LISRQSSLCPAKGFVEGGEYDFQYFQAKRTGNFTADKLGNQGFNTLPGASKGADFNSYMVFEIYVSAGRSS
jgi:hypothetical protein